MTLTQAIKSNPYLKPSNCTDVADVDAAMDALRELDAKYGGDNKTLLKLWAKFLDLKKKVHVMRKINEILHKLFGCKYNTPLVSMYVSFNTRDIIYKCKCGKKRAFRITKKFEDPFPIQTNTHITKSEFDNILNK